MVLIPALCVIFSVLYAILQWKFISSGCPAHSPLKIHDKKETQFCVLVVGRNEEENIEKCLHSIIDQNYPTSHYSIVFVDDQSTDATIELAKSIAADGRLKVLSTGNLPIHKSAKKAAITEVVSRRQADEYILVTDADCVVSPQWLSGWDSYLRHTGVDMATGPVLGSGDVDSVLERYQMLEMCGLMLITCAGIRSGWLYSANGANMGFRVGSFEEVGGYNGNEHIASGDDVFLIQKFALGNGWRVGFCNSTSTIVLTGVLKNWREFFLQRQRWAAKSASYVHLQTKFNAAVVFLCSVFICLTAVYSLFTPEFLIIFAASLAIKSAADYALLQRATAEYEAESLMKFFFLSELIHIGTVVSVGIWGMIFKRNTWKGRSITI